MHFLNRQPARFCQEENRAGHRITAGSGPSGIFSGEMLRGLFPNQGIFPFSQESKHVAKGICPNGTRQEQKARFVSAVGGYAAFTDKDSIDDSAARQKNMKIHPGGTRTDIRPATPAHRPRGPHPHGPARAGRGPGSARLPAGRAGPRSCAPAARPWPGLHCRPDRF